jgi:uncharacterized damage-inducible protein DinB
MLLENAAERNRIAPGRPTTNHQRCTEDTRMLTREDILEELEEEAVRTRRALERVSEEKLDWRPHEKSFSLGQLALHIATIPGTLAQVSTLDTFEIKPGGFPRPTAQSKAEIFTALDESLADARRIVGAMDDATLAEPWKMVDGDDVLVTIPRSAFIRRILLNHWYHHRGQLTVYLRQTGALVPAMYGPSADELPVFT